MGHKMPAKSHPKGIDPAYPQKNFVKASFENKNNMQGWYDYMYGGPFNPDGSDPPKKKASGFGHGVGQRAGKLRLSGKAGAHRIGKK